MERTRGGGTVQKAVAETSARDRIKLVVGLVALGALILFLLQNLQEVDIHFLWFEW